MEVIIDKIVNSGVVTNENISEFEPLVEKVANVKINKESTKLCDYIVDKYPDNEYWGFYLRGILCDNVEHVYTSVKLNNPFAEYTYSKIYTDDETKKIFKKSLYTGHTLAIKDYLEHMTDVLASGESTVDDIITEFKEVEPVIIQRKLWWHLAEFYNVLYTCDKKENEKEYAEKAIEYYLLEDSNYVLPNTNTMYLKLLFDKAKNQAKIIKDLKKVRNMTFDEICKSVLMEYM